MKNIINPNNFNEFSSNDNFDDMYVIDDDSIYDDTDVNTLLKSFK